MSLLDIRGLTVSYLNAGVPTRLVDDVSLTVEAGQVVCLAGESGSGKTMTALSIMRLLEFDGLSVEGEILLNGVDLVGRTQKEMQRVRGAQIGMISQEPAAAFNPTMRIGRQIVQTAMYHTDGNRRELQRARADAERDAVKLLTALEVPDAERCMSRYPHQLSGGMLQRAGLAMALIGNPDLLIADEPTTALDVTVQAQTLDLLRRLRDDRGMAILLITHDLGVANEIADQLAVMYSGRIMEVGAVRTVLAEPRHPYTDGLLSSVPDVVNPADRRRLTSIAGTVPPPTAQMSGCRFAPRCGFATAECVEQRPELLPTDDGTGSLAACWHTDRLRAARSVAGTAR